MKSIASFVLYLHSIFSECLSATVQERVSIGVSLIIILVGPGLRGRALHCAVNQSIFR